jgi:hypothetical protein
MMLNLLRVEEIDPETLLRRSFHQYQHDRTLPDVEKSMNCSLWGKGDTLSKYAKLFYVIFVGIFLYTQM